MSINIGPPAIEELRPRIVVIGVGGAGGNAIANMITAQIEGVDFVVANTDAQALNNAIAETRIQLGPDITQGLGAGARPEVGRAAAEETLEEIERLLDGVHMVFIAAGMGGGTGTGAAPIIAEAARAKGVLTVGVVSKPFMFEGTRRMRAADAGIEELQKHVDTLIVIPNQNLFLVAQAETTFKEAFQLADEVLQQGVRSITDLMIMPGLINLDFADVRSVMGEMGKAMMGTGEGEGPNRALEAAERAIANPLLDGVSMQGAKGVIISIIGGDDMKLLEVDEAANHIRELVDPDANIIWGSAFNPDLQGKIRVSVVATGIEQTAEMAEVASRPLNLSASRGPVRPTSSYAPTTVSYQQAASSYATPPAPAAPVTPRAQPLDFGAGEPAPAPFVPEPYDPASELELGAGDEFASEDTLPEELAPEEVEDETAGGNYASLSGFRAQRGEPLDLGFEDEADAPPSQGSPAVAPPARQQDELRLDGGQALRRPGALAGTFGGAPAEPAAEAPIAPRAKPAGGGSTLFERMTSLSRPKPGASEPAGDDEEGASINIPRFLGRQNNQ